MKSKCIPLTIKFKQKCCWEEMDDDLTRFLIKARFSHLFCIWTSSYYECKVNKLIRGWNSLSCACNYLLDAFVSCFLTLYVAFNKSNPSHRCPSLCPVLYAVSGLTAGWLVPLLIHFLAPQKLQLLCFVCFNFCIQQIVLITGLNWAFHSIWFFWNSTLEWC